MFQKLEYMLVQFTSYLSSQSMQHNLIIHFRAEFIIEQGKTELLVLVVKNIGVVYAVREKYTHGHIPINRSRFAEYKIETIEYIQ